MAFSRGPVVTSTMSLPSFDGSSLSADAQAKIEEYRKIVQFRDEVLAGIHPRVKPLSAKPVPDDSSYPPSAPSGAQATRLDSNQNHAVVENSLSYQANSQNPAVNVSVSFPGLGMLPSTSVNGAAKPFASSKPEINPVLLEKSDDLIKAEIQLQRQRLERGLKDQIDQKRAAAKASQQAPESFSELNLSDVLSQALNLVEAAAAQPTNSTTNNPSNDSDSFDDNTFYSSRHDTPETPQVSRVPNDLDDEQMREDSYEPQLDSPPLVPVPNLPAAEPPSPIRDATSHPNLANLATNSQASARSVLGPYFSGVTGSRGDGLRAGAQAGALIELTSSDGSGPASRSEESGNTSTENTANQGNLYQVNQNLLGQALGRRDSPVVRAHNLSPIAPQPEHVSPLVTSRQRAIVQEDASARQATPAQVAALRQEASAGTTPESSPQGSKNDRKKKKKKKKGDRLATEAAAQSPYIKPEPRSPSPLNAAPYSRPHKRQRPNNSQPASLVYDEPLSAGGSRRPRYSGRSQNREEPDTGNATYSDSRSRDIGQPIDVDAPRYGSGMYPIDLRSSSGNAQGQAGSVSYSTTYGQEPRLVRESDSYPYDHREVSRMSAHPGTARERSRSPRYDRTLGAMPPPRASARIVIDEFGREYIEPSRPPTVVRESLMSGSRVGDAELRYERPPLPHTVSQHPDTLEQDGVLYRRVSPTYVAPRRVLTQPEPVGSEYRAYREREYSVRPLLPQAEDYGAQRTRVVTEMPREFVSRAASVRPSEGIRYETTVGYERRPVDETAREYLPARSASVRPAEGIRYEMPAGYERRVVDGSTAREYGSLRSSSVRPVGYEVVRDYGARYGSVRTETQHREYAASVHPEVRRDAMPPPPEVRSYSVRPFDGAAVPQVPRQDYGVRPVEQYYAQQPRQNEEVVYLEHPPQSNYH